MYFILLNAGIQVFHKTSFDIVILNLLILKKFIHLNRCYRHCYVSEIIQKS